MFWRYCNDYKCRVVEFYCGNENDTTCPACGRAGDKEAY